MLKCQLFLTGWAISCLPTYLSSLHLALQLLATKGQNVEKEEIFSSKKYET
jgi:hypothetical protein